MNRIFYGRILFCVGWISFCILLWSILIEHNSISNFSSVGSSREDINFILSRNVTTTKSPNEFTSPNSSYQISETDTPPSLIINDSVELDINQLDISSVDKLIRSAFNRDSLLESIYTVKNKLSFKNFVVEFQSTGTSSNGIKKLFDDVNNFGTYLLSPKTVDELPPVLVCDYIIFASSFGRPLGYKLLMRWRKSYFEKHRGACMIHFHSDASSLNQIRHSGLVYKMLNHLFLIKSISDGRIITDRKYEELMKSNLLKLKDGSSSRLELRDKSEQSVKNFIKLLTPNIKSGIGIPSDSDLSLYPMIMFLDMDTLITNKNITIDSFLHKIDEGLQLQPILPSQKSDLLSKSKNKNKKNNNNNNSIQSISDVDFIIGTDVVCHRSRFVTINSGVHLSRPSSIMAMFFWMAIHSFTWNASQKGDQRSIIIELDQMTDFASWMIQTECRGSLPRWTNPEFQNRLIFKSPFLNQSKDISDIELSKSILNLNVKRNKHIESIWGSFDDPILIKKRIPLVVIVNGRWMNAIGSQITEPVTPLAWHPGDWIVHFTSFRKEKRLGRRVRRWVCSNLYSVPHPEDWPKTESECQSLINSGFRSYK